MACGVFYIDAFTKVEGAVAVLYAIALLMACESMSSRGMAFAGGASAFAAIVSFVISHNVEAGLPEAIRLSVALAAIGITATLLRRNMENHHKLRAANHALAEGEARYRAIFVRARFALWERDYSGIHRLVLDLKSRGVTDLRQYAHSHPSFIDECIGLVRTVTANDAAVDLLGPSARDTGLGTMSRFITPGDEKFLDLVCALAEGAPVFEDKVTLKADNGERRDVLLNVSFPAAGQFDRVIVGMVDITQREQVQRLLDESRAELARVSRAATIAAMSASLTHKLNQPLGAIVASSQALQRWLKKEPPNLVAVQRAAERMESASLKASDIAEGTRTLLKSASLQADEVDLVDLVNETLKILDRDLEGIDVELLIEARQPVPRVTAVRIELQQVMINLLTNAIQAVERNSSNRKISVELTSRAEHLVCLSVRDNGGGITGDALHRLFEPFFSTRNAGIGLGLPICRSIVEACGGSVTVASGLKNGACFEVSLPAQARVPVQA
jgi:signal transduction histidine kinase